MFDAVRNNKRIAQIILALLIVPFAFFGLDSYFTSGPGGNEIATVGGSKISMNEFDQALRDQQDRLRQSMGGQVDRAMLESEAMRRSVVENLVNQRLLAMHAADSGLVVTQQQLQQVIATVPAFQEDGRFSLERYEAAVRAQGMTPAMFEARLGQDLRVQQVALAVGQSAFTAQASVQRFLEAQLEERKVSELKFSPDAFLAQVELPDDAAKKYYDANPERFERPARLRAEYLVFDENALLKQVSVSDDEIRKFYEANTARFGQPEERNARHILIEAAADAPAEEVAKASEKAAALLAQVRANPERFAELAKAESQDPGSAARGGELGFFGRGAMVKSFEDAVFSLEKGQISDVVRSDFGFHIIQVVDIKPAKARPFEEVRDEIAEELKRQAASRRLAEQAEHFANLVYEQADSLQPAAQELGLEIRQTDWISREEGSIGGFKNEKLLNGLFSDEAVKNGRNVEAVEVSRGTLVSARVRDFEAAQRLPFEEVKASIEKQLRAEEASKLAVARGEAALAALAKGEQASGAWSEARVVRRGSPELAPAAIDAVFGAAESKLPAYAGVAMPEGGYSVFRIESVTRPELAKDDPRLQAVSQQYQRLIAERDFNAFLASLRERYEVEINEAVLRVAQQP
ncbi:PpiC-type peptidyl-prolyl cis-trans isomerase [Aromatoleum aromaticum EbN1]|uniref:Periplasmic chaperone PpiD n=1 Tax=Aromatoleum aromaticum (strain DSM 19018 / LMG 30748 / EbN1) TaxID=76114 RepID=Q5NYD2_AROAE|nr:SurA N-terminal domain-containing protein [Aromatoleum aromaticum]CAI09932.1 PpiC-type peptidyl-prolyl cis-trans isomerase [Aromatoleum aromaticum EbN1]